MFTSLSLETIKKVAPSVFTEEGATHTSEKYQHISTEKVVKALMAEGFVPTMATQSSARLEGKEAYTKHMLRFRRVDARPTMSGLFPEIVLINSHDCLSSYRLMAGIYRLICSNGLTAGKMYNEIRVRHQGDILGKVIEGTYEVVENSKKMLDAAERMRAVELSYSEKKIFAESAHAIRFENSPLSEAIKPVKLLLPRQSAEFNKDDLFTVFNVVQENIIKGGLHGHAKDANGHYKRVSTRAVKSIDQNTSLNRALWTLSEKMMQLKGI
ncbi:DUF932 domain-containing protein [soil metagenome]